MVKDFSHREPNATLGRRRGGGTLEGSVDRADGATGRRLLSYLDGGQMSLHGVTCPSQSTSYHWRILNSCLLCGTLLEILRLSCDNPFSTSSWGATAKRMSRRLTNVLRTCRSLGIRTQKCRDWENTD